MGHRHLAYATGDWSHLAPTFLGGVDYPTQVRKFKFEITAPCTSIVMGRVQGMQVHPLGA